MNLQLIKGHYSKEEALSILTSMVDVKIRFHIDKISQSDNEEDIKMRETRIKQLQKDLHELRLGFQRSNEPVTINSQIIIT